MPQKGGERDKIGPVEAVTRELEPALELDFAEIETMPN
jgi:hypothetical protein